MNSEKPNPTPRRKTMFRSARESTADLLAHTAYQHDLKSTLDDTTWRDPSATISLLDELRRATHGALASIAYTIAATIRPRP